jgi:hypothetical protein
LDTQLSILRGYTEGLQDGRLRGASALYRIMHGEVEHLQRLVEDLRRSACFVSCVGIWNISGVTSHG